MFLDADDEFIICASDDESFDSDENDATELNGFDETEKEERDAPSWKQEADSDVRNIIFAPPLLTP